VTEISPPGTIWWCPHCGRIAADKEGHMAALGWTKQCTQYAVLVLEDSLKVDETGRVIQAALVDKSGLSSKANEIRISPEKIHSKAN